MHHHLHINILTSPKPIIVLIKANNDTKFTTYQTCIQIQQNSSLPTTSLSPPAPCKRTQPPSLHSTHSTTSSTPASHHSETHYFSQIPHPCLHVHASNLKKTREVFRTNPVWYCHFMVVRRHCTCSIYILFYSIVWAPLETPLLPKLDST